MEEAHRIHKDVPFGWFKSLQGIMGAVGQHRADMTHAPWSLPEEPKRDTLDNLPHLAAPR